MSTEKKTIRQAATFSTKGFRTHPYFAIFLATVCGMSFMMLVILLGAHTLIASIALILGILLVYGIYGGYTVFDVEQKGLSRYFEPLISRWFRIRPKQQLFTYDQISSFSFGVDLNRSLEEVRTLYINLNVSPGVIWIQDKTKSTDFDLFVETFRQTVKLYNSGAIDLSEIETSGEAEKKNARDPKGFIGVERNEKAIPAETGSSKQQTAKRIPLLSQIVEKRSFYQRPIAKIITVFFVLMTIGLLILYALGYLRPSRAFQLFALVIPGTAYMYYRVFGKGPSKT